MYSCRDGNATAALRASPTVRSPLPDREEARVTAERCHPWMWTSATATVAVEDIQHGLPSIPDESIDAIITDPPYGLAHADLVRHLAMVASRVLKPGAPCAVLYGHAH